VTEQNLEGHLHVAVDSDVCVSSGNCASIAPGVFDQDEEIGTVILLKSHVGPEEAQAVLTAENLCPSRAITVTRLPTPFKRDHSC
jgi:ferredoxin